VLGEGVADDPQRGRPGDTVPHAYKWQGREGGVFVGPGQKDGQPYQGECIEKQQRAPRVEAGGDESAEIEVDGFQKSLTEP